MRRVCLALLLVLALSGFAQAGLVTGVEQENGVRNYLEGGATVAADISAFIDGPWLVFLFGGTGSMATACMGGCVVGAGSVEAPATPWTFVSATPVRVRITDAFAIGDRFELFDGGMSVGTTIVPPGGAGGISDPAPAFASGQYSTGEFILPAGAHSLTLTAIASPFGAGAAYFRVDTAGPPPGPGVIPEPGSCTLLGAGLALLGLWRWRKSRIAI